MGTVWKFVLVALVLVVVAWVWFKRAGRRKNAEAQRILLQQSDRGPGTTIIPPPSGNVAPGLPYLQAPLSPASALVGGVASPAGGIWRSPQQVFLTAVDTVAGPTTQDRSGRGAF